MAARTTSSTLAARRYCRCVWWHCVVLCGGWLGGWVGAVMLQVSVAEGWRAGECNDTACGAGAVGACN